MTVTNDLKLENPEYFHLRQAFITGYCEKEFNLYELRCCWKFSHDVYMTKSIRGAKMIFTREFGKGAKWIAELNKEEKQ